MCLLEQLVEYFTLLPVQIFAVLITERDNLVVPPHPADRRQHPFAEGMHDLDLPFQIVGRVEPGDCLENLRFMTAQILDRALLAFENLPSDPKQLRTS